MDEPTIISSNLLKGWEEEIKSAQVYARLAAREPDERRQAILDELASTERRHAARWAEHLAARGVELPDPDSVSLPRTLDLSLRFAPLNELLRHQEAEERRLASEHSDRDLDADLQELAREDTRHATVLGRLLDEMAQNSSDNGALVRRALDRLLARETWHKRGGGWISGAIYGVNDGLAAVFGIVSGTAAAFSGSSSASNIVLVAGLSGAIASALSMGCGAYLATKSEAEVHEARLEGERREIAEDPESELAELELIYQLKGLSEAEARLMAHRLSQDPKALLATMAHEELGLEQEADGSPTREATAAAASTALGAAIPVVPFVFMHGGPAVITAASVSIVAHFLVGAAKSVLTLRSWWASGIEMTVAGILVGGATYGVGLLVKLAGG